MLWSMFSTRKSSDFDTSDPLGALMVEWRQTTTIFWYGMVTAGALVFSPLERVAWLVGIAVLGMPLLLLGQSLVIVGNELRKSGKMRPHSSEEAR